MLLDFNLAEDTKDLASAAVAQVGGTLPYMPPEALDAFRDNRPGADPRGDVYALGVILYELLTGRLPFGGDTPLEVLHNVVSEDPLPPRRLRPDVPCDLEAICLKCLEREPHRRFASALELAEDLHRFLAGEPTLARPAGVVERVLRWAGRRPVLARWLRG